MTSGSSDQPRRGGNLVAFLTSNFPIDPQKVSKTATLVPGIAMSRIFTYKTSTGAATITDHVTEPDVGLSAESPDAIAWTVKLRPNATFQNIPPVNGHAVEAEDIKASFTRALDPSVDSPNRGQLNMIDASQITTPDKQTVIFKLNFPYAPFTGTLASPVYSLILPREAAAGTYDPGKVVIGSGPFIMDSIQPDVAFSYKKNTDWYLAPQPYVDTLKVAIIPDTSQQLAQFSAGNLDELQILNLNDVQTVQRQNPAATVYKVAYGGPNPLYFQMGDPSSPFRDIRARRAISMLVDRDAITKAVYNGQSEQVVFVPSRLGKWALHVQDLDPSVQQYYKYNPAEAKKLLEAAGQSGLQIRLVNPFASLHQAYNAAAVEAINQSFNSNGIKSSIVNGDYNKDFVDAGRGWRQGYFSPDMVIYGSGPPYDEADADIFSYFGSKSSEPQERLDDPTLDAMVAKERTLVNEADRVKAVTDLQKYLAEQLYAPSTVGQFAWWATHQRVRNYCFSDSNGKGTETYAKIWLKAKP